MTKSERQDRAREERSLEVCKSNDMVQKARFSLSIQEQRTILYAISKIKPEDTYLKEYTFEIKDFYTMIGWSNQSYTEFKAMLKALSDKSWWITIKREDGSEFESLVRWFTTVRSDKRSGKVTVKFHEDMMPFLLQLAQGTEFYTTYKLQYVLPMSSQYSPRLYELLKSYQFNNKQWFFEIDELKHKLDCKNYTNFADFKRFALEPAVKEINKYTDIIIDYLVEKEGRKVVRIKFFMAKKTKAELLRTEWNIENELEQLTITDIVAEARRNTGEDFFAERRRIEAEDQAREKALESFYGKKR